MNDMLLNTDSLSLEELDNLSITDLLGEDMSQISLSSNLPDGTYAFVIEKYETKSFPAKPEDNKKARRTLNVTLNVVAVLALTDTTEDTEKLVGRKHFESYDLLSDFGRASFIKLLLGIVGVSFTDKKAIAEVGQAPAALLEELKASKVAFGGQVKTVERNGFENCNLVLKPKAFIDMNQILELLEG